MVRDPRTEEERVGVRSTIVMGNVQKNRHKNAESSPHPSDGTSCLWKEAITSKDVVRVQLIVEILYGEDLAEAGWIRYTETTHTLFLHVFHLLNVLYPISPPTLHQLITVQREVCAKSILVLATDK